MASHIELLIFDGDGVPAALLSSTKIVSLSEQLRLVPVSGDLRSPGAARDPDAEDAVYPGWALKARACRLACDMSSDRRVLYVCGETFGGPGTQEAAGWDHGKLVYGPAGTCDLESDREPGYRVVPRSDRAVNVGLRMMGVRASVGLDEYAAVGLARHRFTEDWLTDIGRVARVRPLSSALAFRVAPAAARQVSPTTRWRPLYHYIALMRYSVGAIMGGWMLAGRWRSPRKSRPGTGR